MGFLSSAAKCKHCLYVNGCKAYFTEINSFVINFRKKVLVLLIDPHEKTSMIMQEITGTGNYSSAFCGP